MIYLSKVQKSTQNHYYYIFFPPIFFLTHFQPPRP
nr:MAG TPA: hypothetical protein [Caudoviricetes sp.]